MSFVAVKNVLFPRQSSERQPLLPTAQQSPPPASAESYGCGYCSQKGCQNSGYRRSSACSTSSSNSTVVTAATSPSTVGGGGDGPPWIDARTVSDAIIGLSDGLTVPFALTAGLSAFNDTRVVIFGGCAELIAGSISMGLGGWLAGRGEAEYYNSTLQQTRKLVSTSPEDIPDMITEVFKPYRLPLESVAPLVAALTKDPSATTDFLMSFHHSLPSADSTKRTPLSSALTIAAGYFLGGAIPLSPYFFVAREDVIVGLWWSVGVMAVCLFVFGVVRDIAVGEGSAGLKSRIRGGIEMVMVGGVAAGASWGIVKALG